MCTLHSLGNAWAVVDTFIICGWLVQISNILIDNVFFFFPYKTALLLCCTDHYVLSCDRFTVFQCAAQLRAVCDVTVLIEFQVVTQRYFTPSVYNCCQVQISVVDKQLSFFSAGLRGNLCWRGLFSSHRQVCTVLAVDILEAMPGQQLTQFLCIFLQAQIHLSCSAKLNLLYMSH